MIIVLKHVEWCTNSTKQAIPILGDKYTELPQNILILGVPEYDPSSLYDIEERAQFGEKLAAFLMKSFACPVKCFTKTDFVGIAVENCCVVQYLEVLDEDIEAYREAQNKINS